MTRILTIGGMDSSAGAGLLRDQRAALENDTQIYSVVTAVTAQTDGRVLDIAPMTPSTVIHQIKSAGPVAAIKTGMLTNATIVDAVADHLPSAPVIADPVLRSSSGADLMDPNGFDRFAVRILPRCHMVTPNRHELTALNDYFGTENCVDVILRLGCRSVLVKGGHDDGDYSVDVLYERGLKTEFAARRRNGSRRGTGCQMATAIAARVAKGDDLPTAVSIAKSQINQRWDAPEYAC